MAGFDFGTVTNLQAQADAAQSDANALTNAKGSAAMNAVGDVAKGVFTSSPKAFMNYILANGANSIELGIKELKDAGQLDPNMEAMFRSIDTSDQKQVQETLLNMAKLKQAWKAKELATANDKKAMDFANDSVSSYMAEQEQRISEMVGPDGKPVSENTKEMARKAAREEAASRVRSEAAFKLGDQDVLAASRNRFGDEPVTKQTAMGDRVTWGQNNKIINSLATHSNVIPAFRNMTQTANDVFDRNGDDVWGLMVQSPGYQAATNKWDAVKQQLAQLKKGDTVNPNLVQQAVSALADFAIPNELSDKEVQSSWGLNKQQREDINNLLSATGMVVAEYIKSISGATVSESERASLLNNLNFRNYTSASSFARSMNAIMRIAQEKAMADEVSLASGAPEAWDKYVMNLTERGGMLPSDKLAGLSIQTPAKRSTQAAEAKPAPPPKPSQGQATPSAKPGGGVNPLTGMKVAK